MEITTRSIPCFIAVFVAAAIDEFVAGHYGMVAVLPWSVLLMENVRAPSIVMNCASFIGLGLLICQYPVYVAYLMWTGRRKHLAAGLITVISLHVLAIATALADRELQIQEARNRGVPESLLHTCR